MVELKRFHAEGGETGHFGEFLVGLGLLILAFGVAIVVAGLFVLRPWSTGALETDAITSGALFSVFGIGVVVFGAFAVFSGWGRHHPQFETGDPEVADVYDKEGS